MVAPMGQGSNPNPNPNPCSPGGGEQKKIQRHQRQTQIQITDPAGSSQSDCLLYKIPNCSEHPWRALPPFPQRLCVKKTAASVSEGLITDFFFLKNEKNQYRTQCDGVECRESANNFRQANRSCLQRSPCQRLHPAAFYSY